VFVKEDLIKKGSVYKDGVSILLFCLSHIIIIIAPSTNLSDRNCALLRCEMSLYIIMVYYDE